MSFKNYVLAFRLHAQLMTWTSMLVYYSYGRLVYGVIGYQGFICVVVSAMFFHMAANSIAEYRDYMNGIDSEDSKGASKLPLKSIKNSRNVYTLGLICFVIAVVSGLRALYYVGYNLLIPGVITAILVIGYSEKPLMYKYKAMGEVGVFIAFGPLLCYSCIYALCGQFAYSDFIVSISIGCLVACVMLANNIRDYLFDKAIGNRTLPTVCGLRASYSVLFGLAHLAYFCLLFIHRFNVIWPVFCTYAIIFLSIKRIDSPKLFDVFLLLHVAFCVVLGCIFLLV